MKKIYNYKLKLTKASYLFITFILLGLFVIFLLNIIQNNTLSKVYNNSLSYCDSFNFEATGAYRDCLDNKIVSELKKSSEYKQINTYNKIKTYCYNTTSCEADYRACIDKKIIKVSNIKINLVIK